ncbi:MAG: T9SS type A sorting domain-containing protein [Crocinitomicaceae bacterium]
MKKCIITLLFSGTVFMTYSQSTVIPDSNFEQALIDLNIDSDGLNSSILNSDALQVTTTLNVSYKNISDLTGIEAFENIETLNCRGNNLSSLNLTSNLVIKNVEAQYNQINQLNISGLQLIELLHVQENQLSNLDVSNLSNLFWLDCNGNNLTNLDLTNNSELLHLYCSSNLFTGVFDISNQDLLQNFTIASNQITAFNFVHNSPIRNIDCRWNNITNLDLSTLWNLKRLYASNNNLSTLNVANGANVQIIDFQVTENPNLFCINVDDPTYSSASINWFEDPQSNYSNSCAWLSIDEKAPRLFDIYPNPAIEFIKISLNDSQVDFGELISLNGKLIKRFKLENSNFQLNLTDVESGIYFIRIANVQSKLVKY